MIKFDEYRQQQGFSPKLWKAKKSDVLEHWKNLETTLNISMNPVDSDHKGSKFRSDGVRITGSPVFINSILSRIKDIAYLEDKTQDRLEVEYRQIGRNDINKSLLPSYVFYCHLIKSNDSNSNNIKNEA